MRLSNVVGEELTFKYLGTPDPLVRYLFQNRMRDQTTPFTEIEIQKSPIRR